MRALRPVSLRVGAQRAQLIAPEGGLSVDALAEVLHLCAQEADVLRLRDVRVPERAHLVTQLCDCEVLERGREGGRPCIKEIGR